MCGSFTKKVVELGVVLSVALLAVAAPAAAMRCTVDVGGANDEPGQKDVTQFCVGLGSESPFDVHTSASLDLTGVSGGNTADLCLLFDSDADNKVNLALCSTVSWTPAVLSDVRLLTCNDGDSDKCGGAVQFNVCSGSSSGCLTDEDCGFLETCSQQFNTVCDAGQEATDPFLAGDNSPWDTVLSCAIDLDEFGPAGATARLINMGTYASSSLSSSISDSVLFPACDSDSDCAQDQVCHFASGECYTPTWGCTTNADCPAGLICDGDSGTCVPGGCATDADCPAGDVCNLETGQCETPSGTGCTDDVDCATGLVCDVETGLCVDPDACSVDADCADGEVCNGGVCEPDGGTTTTLPGGECVVDADCAPGEVCNGDVCEPDGSATTTTTIGGGECVVDADCAPGEVCNGGVCEPDGGATTTTIGDGTTTTLPGGGCIDDAECPVGEICNAGVCEPDGTATTTTTLPGGCDDDGDCAQGVCNVATGSCEPSAPCADDFECEGLDNFCGIGVCDSSTQTCAVEPQNEGASCTEDADVCTSSNVCAGGACVGVPLCDPLCSICDGGECLSMCGNPFNALTTGVTITDALFILRTGVGLEQCPLCVCDVDNDGDMTAVDALKVERLVIRLPGQLECPSSN